MASSARLSKGDRIWVAHAQKCYVPCTVSAVGASEVQCFDAEYAKYTVPRHEVMPVNPESMDGVEDNTQLMYLHDPSLLHNIRHRYERGDIYTYTASILIAVNPYRRLDLYGPEAIRQYANKALGRLPPHVYAIADRAFRTLRATNKSQSIVVSGESGAGKTETCKLIMRFLASTAGTGDIGTITELEARILEANPVLEAFGNAKTVRNNNSSRFGKYTELHFDRTNELCAASVETYLLEKSRIVRRSNLERSFHVFYQLLAGASPELAAQIQLLPLPQYDYLADGAGAALIPGVDDRAEFLALCSALSTLNVDGASQFALWQTLSGILHLGNIKFRAGGDGACDIDPSSSNSCKAVAALLGVSEELVRKRLVIREMRAGNTAEAISIGLSLDECLFARDSLAKYLYGAVFDWLVRSINANFPQNLAERRSIGLLDISGFEIFEHNSFEQFLINFSNEKIQQYFNREILDQEQQIYELEGLRYRQVEYQDNQSIIDLVEAKQGVLALLNEACLMPRGSDNTFTIKLHTTHSGNINLDKPRHVKSKKKLGEDEAFVVHHFAGDVTYETRQFLHKNNDSIHDELVGLLRTSTNAWLCAVLPDAQNEPSDYGPTGGRFKSVCTSFQQQLSSLMVKLGSTTSHFIRCIKPNGQQAPGLFEPNDVLVQLRYSGMCAALLLMQAGFPTRISFQELFNKYAPKMPQMMAKLKPITFCEALLVALDLHGGKDFQMGLTKVFFRPGKLAFMDELTNSSSSAEFEAVVHKVRRWLARKRFFAAGKAVVSINRLGTTIRRLRAARQFVRTARFMVLMSRTWLPLLAQVRSRLYSEEVLRARREAEEERQRQEEALRLQREQEAEAARKAEEERRRQQEEEARRVVEEQKRKELAAKRALEEKIEQLSDKNARLVTQVASLTANLETTLGKYRQEESAREQLQLQMAEQEHAAAAQLDAMAALQSRMEQERERMTLTIRELTTTMQGDQAALAADLQRVVTEKEELAKERADTLEENRDLSKKLETTKVLLEQNREALQMQKSDSNTAMESLAASFEAYKVDMEGKLASVVQQLSVARSDLEETSTSLAASEETVARLSSDVGSLTASVEYYSTKLSESEQAVQAAQVELRMEQHEREDEKHAASEELRRVSKRAERDSEVKNALISTLRADKEGLEQQLQTQSATKDAQIADLQAQLAAVEQHSKDQENHIAQLKKELASSKERVTLLERERNNLIEKAMKCQVAQMKLLEVYSKFKKEEDLAAHLFGDISFNGTIRTSPKFGVLLKQGGADTKKWQSRHVVLHDFFLFYYSSKSEKKPRGAVRLDQCLIEEKDFSEHSIKYKFAIQLSVFATGREFRFAAATVEERDEWIAAMRAAAAALH
eukprot:m.24471 g.24471  ORF g.24471 m.24471 type:complete len:1371 (-) comp4280_c0_seq1:120-4232(-)